MKIVYKGDPEKIKILSQQGFNDFELYVRNSQDLELNFKNVIALHFHYKLDDGRTINLADEGEIGELSEVMLKKAIECAKRNGVKKVVFHPPTVNLFKVSKEKAIKTMVQRLENVHDPDVLLCIENTCLWISQAHNNEPLFVEPEDYFKIINESKVPIGLTFDVEHFHVTAVMKLFYEQYRKDLLDVDLKKINYENVVKKFESSLQGNFQESCHQFVSQALEKLKPYINHVHVCGSDFNKYFFNPQSTLPLIGEHLPIYFSGKSYGHDVKDRIDHNIWIEKLKDTDLDIVMEISPKDGYDFIDLLYKSRIHLENLKLLQLH